MASAGFIPERTRASRRPATAGAESVSSPAKTKPRRRTNNPRLAANPPAAALEPGATAALRIGAAEAVLTIDALWQRHHALVDAEDAARRAGLFSEAVVHRNNSDRVFKQISAIEDLGVSSIPTNAVDATAHLLLLRDMLENLGGEHLTAAGERRIGFILSHMVWALKALSEAHGLPLAKLARTYFNHSEQAIARGEVAS